MVEEKMPTESPEIWLGYLVQWKGNKSHLTHGRIEHCCDGLLAGVDYHDIVCVAKILET